jgi:hypothetical protein
MADSNLLTSEGKRADEIGAVALPDLLGLGVRALLADHTKLATRSRSEFHIAE